jgi:prepilin-type N-terminal cleavage/methylation domain-containing protein
MARKNITSRKGFSLIELVIVVVIIGIIAAIAIPRMSRGTAGAADSALGGNLNVLRNALELYATEHNGKFPGHNAATTPVEGLTMYTDDQGGKSATKTGNFIYGPYLRKIPPITVGPLKNDNTKNNTFAAGTAVEATPTAGWMYDKDSGTILANTPNTEVDQNGKQYNQY